MSPFHCYAQLADALELWDSSVEEHLGLSRENLSSNLCHKRLTL